MIGAVGYALTRMRDRSTISVALAALVGLVIAGCGSSSGAKDNGVAAKTPGQVIAAATRAVDALHTLRVSGAVADGSSSTAIKLDLNLVAGRGATGSMAENGLSFKLITVNGSVYINGSPSFWRQFGGAAVQRRLQGKWLKAPADHGQFASFSSLTNVHKLVANLLDGHGALTKGAVSMLGGQKVIALRDEAKHGTLYVATTGTPYPLRIVNSATGGGELDFSDFNRAVTLTPPASSVDISQLSAK